MPGSEAIAKAINETRQRGDKITSKVVQDVFDTVLGMVKAGERVTIPGFGAFHAKLLPAGQFRDPSQSGRKIDVPERRKLRFVASESLRKLDVPPPAISADPPAPAPAA